MLSPVPVCPDSDPAVSMDVSALLFTNSLTLSRFTSRSRAALLQQSFIGYLLMVSKLLRSCDVTPLMSCT